VGANRVNGIESGNNTPKKCMKIAKRDALAVFGAHNNQV